jgi:hypothetical protein
MVVWVEAGFSQVSDPWLDTQLGVAVPADAGFGRRFPKVLVGNSERGKRFHSLDGESIAKDDASERASARDAAGVLALQLHEERSLK